MDLSNLGLFGWGFHQCSHLPARLELGRGAIEGANKQKTESGLQKAKGLRQTIRLSIALQFSDKKEFRTLSQIRDQGVGGSNPLSPTNCLQRLTISVQASKTEHLVSVQVLWRSHLHNTEFHAPEAM